MVARAAQPVERLAFVSAQHVDLTGVGHGLQGAVDRGQPHFVTTPTQQLVDLLGAAKLVELGQGAADRKPLTGDPQRCTGGGGAAVSDAGGK